MPQRQSITDYQYITRQLAKFDTLKINQPPQNIKKTKRKNQLYFLTKQGLKEYKD